MRVLDLFSGIGGFSLGLERAGMETVAFCEIDEYPRKVLAKHWPDVPCYDDIRTLTKERLDDDGIGSIDVICGGYPCQPFSTAGKRKGKDDDRHLWPEYLRLIQGLRPAWVIAENVTGHISMGLDQVLSDLEGEGYAWWPFAIPACAVDADHRRERIWIIANATLPDDEWSKRGATHGSKSELGEGSSKVTLFTNANDQRREGVASIENTIQQQAESWDESLRGIETVRVRSDLSGPVLIGANDGVTHRVDRIKALGNAVVPQIPEIIGRAIMSLEAQSSDQSTPA